MQSRPERKKEYLLWPLGLLMVLSLSIAPVLAQTGQTLDDFNQGLQYYQAKNYNQARMCFEKSLQKYPKSWQLQLYLGHCYLALGRPTAAKNAYDAVLNANASAEAKKNAQDGIDRVGRLGAGSGSSSSASSTTASAKPASSDDDEDGGATASAKPKSSVEIQNERDRADVLKRAREEVAKIRAEGKANIAAAKANANHVWKDRETGRIFNDLDPADEQAMEDEIEAKCEKIMEEAERKARSIH